MLRSLKGLKGYSLQASDGKVGKVENFLFDDEMWVVRYFVVRTGGWITGRRVLISPYAVRRMDWEERSVHVNLTREQVDRSPDVDTEQPISRQMEVHYASYYRWPYYWTGAGIWGIPDTSRDTFPRAVRRDVEENCLPGDRHCHLRSVKAVTGYHVDAVDADFGNVEDFIVDGETWQLRYLVVDTINWWPSRRVLVSPEWIEALSWRQKRFRLNLTHEQIKNSPRYKPGAFVNRDEEERLYDYYGRPKYWEHPPGEMKVNYIDPGRLG